MIKMTQTKENERVVSLKSGNKIFLTREDPYGLWVFSFERGPIPKELEGYFTTIRNAEVVLTAFIEESKFEVGEKEEPPELKTKKVGPKAAARAKELKQGDTTSHAA